MNISKFIKECCSCFRNKGPKLEQNKKFLNDLHKATPQPPYYDTKLDIATSDE